MFSSRIRTGHGISRFYGREVSLVFGEPLSSIIPEKVLSMSATWRKRAACRGIDVDIFYPDTEDDVDAVEAKAICAECPVRQACLEHALANREREGIWGGTTERERRRIVRQRRKSA